MTIDDLFQRGLNLEKLRSFLAIAQKGSVTKAAHGDSSRRSLMSRQLGELERCLGFELFNRNGRTIEITERGRELALLIAAFFTEFEEATKRGHQQETLLRIGGGASVLEALIFPRLKQLENRFPNTRFEFRGFSTKEILDALSDGKVDLGIVPSGQNLLGIIEIPIGEISFVLVGRRNFDKGIANWSLKAFLQRVPLVIIGGNGRWIEAYHAFCQQMNIHPRILHRAETFGHVKALLNAGASGCFLPKPLTTDLSSKEFIIFNDPSFRILDRPLSVVFDERMSRIRDHLAIKAQTLAEIIEC